MTVVFLCCAGMLFADLPKSGLVPSDPAAFLHNLPSSPNKSSFEIEPWFAAGVTNGDRSPKFVQRLRDASAKGNAIVQGLLGLLLVKDEGIPPDATEGMRLLRSSAAQGCLPAMAELGYIYLGGTTGCPQIRRKR